MLSLTFLSNIGYSNMLHLRKVKSLYLMALSGAGVLLCAGILMLPVPASAGTVMNQHLEEEKTDIEDAADAAGIVQPSVINPAMSYENMEASDPLEEFNRAVFQFNAVFDNFLMKPIARAYVFAVPDEGRERVTYFLRNLIEPVNMANAILQGDPNQAFTSFWRFILNSTFGIGGLFDFAGANSELQYRGEDFGQTLGCYGAGNGAYLVLPILGPSNLRDLFGTVADRFMDPFNYLEEEPLMYWRYGLGAVDGRARALPITDDIEETSFDPYVTYRSGYTQYRHNQIRNGGDYPHPTICP